MRPLIFFGEDPFIKAGAAGTIRIGILGNILQPIFTGNRIEKKIR